MAQRPPVVAPEATSIPEPADIARVATFAREPFVCDGEVAEDVLAPGSIRRHAFEFARAELDAGAEVPSQKWRRRWSLLLGLDRALHTEVPVLADGTTLNPHQVDALSGTYAALLADAQRRARGDGTSDGDALLLSFEDDEPTQLDEPPPRVTPADEDEDEPDDGPAEPGDEEDEDDEDEFGKSGRSSVEDELEELPDAEPENESALYDDEVEEDVDEDIDAAALDDPNAHKRFWFEHATGAGKTVAAMGFVEACRTGGVLILTHRRNLVDQFIDELQTRGYGERLSKPLLGDDDRADGPVTIETYQWFVRNAGQISGAYTVVICDEAHTALGEKTSATIRAWTGPIFIGMTATGALIARHVTDLFPTQTSRFDLAQAARRGVIAPLRSLRIPPGPGVRTIAKVPLRKGEVDMEFDQDELAKLLDQAPFNLAIADLYKTRFRNTPGVVYTAGVQHAYNVAESFRALDMKAEAVSGETPKRELAKILADYEAGDIDVLVNAQLLAEGWNSPRATICMHLAPTASKRIYQQRVGRVTRRHPGKEAGVVIDFVHPATSNDDPVVTLHSLLDRDVYRGGAIVVGPVRRGRGRRVKVERRVLPVTPDIERRRDVFERELWRIAVEQLDWGEQRIWAALAGAKASPANWRRGRAMLNFDRSGELRRQFLITALERNRNPQLRMRSIQEIAVLREAEPFDTAIDHVGQWPREERREASRTLLQAMADRRIGRRDQATAWIWRLAEYTRDLHEEYAAQRWPATKHLLGLLVNSSGAAHARNARRLVHAARQHDRRLQAALLAAAVAHTPEAEEVLREARTRLARKPGALSRDLLKDFPSGKRRKKRSRNKKKGGENGVAQGTPQDAAVEGVEAEGQEGAVATLEAEETQGQNGQGQGGNGQGQGGNGAGNPPGTGRRSRSRRGRSRGGRRRGGQGGGDGTPVENGDEPVETITLTVPVAGGDPVPADTASADVSADQDTEGDAPPRRRRVRGRKAAEARAAAETDAGPASEGTTLADAPGPTHESAAELPAAASADDAPRPVRRRRRTGGVDPEAAEAAPTVASAAPPELETPKPRRTRRTAAQADAPTSRETPTPEPTTATPSAPAEVDAAQPDAAAKPKRTRKTAAQKAAEAATTADAAPAVASTTPSDAVAEAAKPKRAPRKTAAQKAAETAAATDAPPAAPVEAATSTDDAPAKPKRAPRKTAAQKAAEAATADATSAADAAAETPKPKRAPRKTAAQKAAETAAATDAPPAAAPAEAATSTDDAPAKPKRAPRKTAAQKAAEAATADATSAADAAAETPKPKRAPRKTAAQKAAETAAATDAPPAAAPAEAAASIDDAPAKPKRAPRKTAAQKAAEAAAADATSAADAAAETPKPKRAPRKTAAQKAAETAAATDAPPAAAPAEAATSTDDAPAKPKRAPRKTAAQKAAEAAAADATSAADAATETPKPKRTPRKTAAQKAAEAAAATDAAAPTSATDDAPAKPKRAPRKTAAQKAAEAAAADATAAGDAAAETPKPKRAPRATAAKSTGTTTTRRRAGTTKKVDEPA